jgi:hypothetical protein
MLTVALSLLLATSPAPAPEDWRLSVAFSTQNLTPAGGISAERRVSEHWLVSLGASASLSTQNAQTSASLPYSGLSVLAVPGVRYAFTEAFEGGWLSARVPLSWSRTELGVMYTTGDGSLASRAAVTHSYSLGVDLLAGWSFRLGEHFSASVAAGPQLSWTHATLNAPLGGLSSLGLASSARVALLTEASFGAVF